ncbi:MAG: glutamate--tRNA ligase [bacterium]|nr:glutamate--tRNA ligase [bacterium]
MNETVRTRIAPSPTGLAHLGTIYQALINYAYAKGRGGNFIWRSEDTDQARFVKGAEENLNEHLHWFGLVPDESPFEGGKFEPYRQSERLETYQKYAKELISKDHAYYCFCTSERLTKVREQMQKDGIPPMYDKYCINLSIEESEERVKKGENFVIRMKIPLDETIKVYDEVLGEILFDSNTIDDQVLIKSDGFPTYHMAVVVDDYLMEITHMVRAREWLPSSPKQVLLYRYFGWELPKLIHVPVILNSDGKGKLSKRHGHSSADYYRLQGFLPKAILNYLAQIIWNHPKGKEIFDVKDFVKYFDFKDISSQGPRFDLDKLKWINGQYIRKLKVTELYEMLVEHYTYTKDEETLKWLEDKDYSLKVIPLIQERLSILSDFKGLVSYFYMDPRHSETEAKNLLIKSGQDKDQIMVLLSFVHDEIKKVESWKTVNLHKVETEIRNLAEKNTWKTLNAFMPIRVALTGTRQSPPLFDVIEVLGQEKTLQRLNQAIQSL